MCHRFLAIKEHSPALYVIVRNTTVIEPEQEPVKEPEQEGTSPEVHDGGLMQQSGDDPVIKVDIEEKAIDEDPVVEEAAVIEPPSPPQPTIVHKLILRMVPLKENLTTTDLHDIYEFKRWEKLPSWDGVLNPADGLLGTALEGKVGELIGLGYEYWYKTPKWAFAMALALLLKWLTYVFQFLYDNVFRNMSED